jgi:hypothetical protein
MHWLGEIRHRVWTIALGCRRGSGGVFTQWPSDTASGPQTAPCCYADCLLPRSHQSNVWIYTGTLGCRIWAILDLTRFCIINKLAYDGAGKGGIEVYPQFSSLTHDDDLETSNGGTPLSCAAGKGHVSVVRLLLEHGAAVDSRNDRGRTPLDSKNDCGRTPLSYATEKGHESVVRLLLEYNALH